MKRSRKAEGRYFFKKRKEKRLMVGRVGRVCKDRREMRRREAESWIALTDVDMHSVPASSLPVL